MHDVLEGLLPYQIKLLLVEYISNKHYFSLQQLNGRISSFKYGVSVSNRPPVISAANLCSADKSLRQSGKIKLIFAMYTMGI